MLCFINAEVEAGPVGHFTRALSFMLLHGHMEAEADADAVRQTRSLAPILPPPCAQDLLPCLLDLGLIR